MTMARAKRRALSASTDLIAAPSRRCKCQSSGRFRVRRSIGPILLGALHGLAIQLALRRTGNARGKARRIARRELLEQHLERALGVLRRRRARLSRRKDQD